MTRLRLGHRYGQRLESLSRLMILALLVILPFGLPGQSRGQTDDPPAETTPDNAAAMRWWDALNPEQRLAALHGDDEPTPEQTAAAENPYADLDMATKVLVNDAADAINGNVRVRQRRRLVAIPRLPPEAHCRRRLATPRMQTSPYCDYYPGSGRTPLLGADRNRPVWTRSELALLGRMDRRRLSLGQCLGHALVERSRRGSKGCRVARRRRNTRTRAKGRRRTYVRGSGPGDQKAGSYNHRGNRRHHPLEQRRRLVGVPQLPPEARRHGRRQHRRPEQPLLRHTIRAPA